MPEFRTAKNGAVYRLIQQELFDPVTNEIWAAVIRIGARKPQLMRIKRWIAMRRGAAACQRDPTPTRQGIGR